MPAAVMMMSSGTSLGRGRVVEAAGPAPQPAREAASTPAARAALNILVVNFM